MKIAVIGTGYVGLVTGACLSEFGIEAWCVDIDQDKVDALRRGEIPIYEPQLEELVVSNHEEGNLHFTTKMSEAVPQADVVMIAVGTPEMKTGEADLQYVFAAAEEIARHLSGYTVVTTKSTVPVGTSRAICARMKTVNPTADFDVASNPEFLREGSAVMDFMRPDRIVVGADTERAHELMQQLYRPLVLGGVHLEASNPETSELAKYAANSFLAVKVTFINEVADLCDEVVADVGAVSRSMGMDFRIAPTFLNAGPGYGGSCFPKDTKAFARMGREFGARQTIVDSVILANNRRKEMLAGKVAEACGGSVKGKNVAVLGVAFKPNTDDVRESPALDLLPGLREAGANVSAHDPKALFQVQREVDDETITYHTDLEDCISDADAVVVLTEWDDYKELEPDWLHKKMRGNTFVDFRNLYDTEEMLESGFEYFSVGRPRALYQARDGRSVALQQAAE